LPYPSQSEADFAFATVLAYHHKGDRDKMAEDFRASKLYRDKWDRLEEPTFDKVLASIDLNDKAAAAPLASASTRAITDEEISNSIDEEYPVYPIGEQAGPYWDDEWMYGIAGEMVRKAAKYCEAHPSGMYIDLVVSLGSMIGRGPYFRVGATTHYTNEFIIRVGNTSTGRKGTGRDAINEPLKLIDHTWYHDRVMAGFGSGEAIVGQIADPRHQSVRDTKSSTGFKNILVPGVNDKRLFIREGEAASVFKLASKDGSRADIILRDGWDGMPLSNLVKGKTEGINNSAGCKEPHISISGDTTRDELISSLPKGADKNGFGNRFLYNYVCRVKYCPNGGPMLDWTDEIVRLHEIMQFARSLRYVPLTAAAAKVWNRMYMEVEQEIEGLPKLTASMCARGAAHIRRLALILALLEKQDSVDTCHLHAAKRIWDYCLESGRFIFEGTTRDQLRIVDWMELHRDQTVSIRDIADEVFHRHRKVEWVKLQMSGLVKINRVSVSDDGMYWLQSGK
jgi:hypothetical protein